VNADRAVSERARGAPSCSLLRYSVRVGIERRQRARAEALEVALQPGKGFGTRAIDARVPDTRVHDEAAILEHFEVLRNGRAANGKVCGDSPDRGRLSRYGFKDGPPRGIAQRLDLPI